MWHRCFQPPGSVSVPGFTLFRAPQPPRAGILRCLSLSSAFSLLHVKEKHILKLILPSWSFFSLFLRGRGLGLFQPSLASGEDIHKTAMAPVNLGVTEAPPYGSLHILIYLRRLPSLNSVFEGTILRRIFSSLFSPSPSDCSIVDSCINQRFHSCHSSGPLTPDSVLSAWLLGKNEGKCRD